MRPIRSKSDNEATAVSAPGGAAGLATSGGESTDDAPKEIMSRAERRRAKKPQVTVTTQMREAARENKRELRKYLRMLKSNGARRKVAKLTAKRKREPENEVEEAAAHFDLDQRPQKKGRRLESSAPYGAAASAPATKRTVNEADTTATPASKSP